MQSDSRRPDEECLEPAVLTIIIMIRMEIICLTMLIIGVVTRRTRSAAVPTKLGCAVLIDKVAKKVEGSRTGKN